MKLKFLAALLLSLSMLTVHAVEYPGPFVITKTKVANATNYHFRVYSDGGWHCYNGPTSPSWSYINEADSGAKTKIVQLMIAAQTNKTVTLVTESVTNNGTTYCRIVAVEM